MENDENQRYFDIIALLSFEILLLLTLFFSTSGRDSSPSVPPSPSPLQDKDAGQTPARKRKVPHDDVEDAFLHHLQEKAEEKRDVSRRVMRIYLVVM